MSRLLKNRPKLLYPRKIKDIIKLITIDLDGIEEEITPIGSFSQSIQEFWSDVDVNELIEATSINQICEALQNQVHTIINTPGILFSDFKAADMHWSFEEILKGEKNGISLCDALITKSIVKLDVIFWFDNRFVEGSSFFLIDTPQGSNYDQSFFDNMLSHIAQDGIHYWDTNKLKTLKRVWSIARFSKDIKTLEILYPILISDIQRLSRIRSDIETLFLIFEKVSREHLPYDKIKSELDGIIDNLSSISLTDLSSELLINISYSTNSLSSLQNYLKILSNHLLQIINEETLIYLKDKNFNPILYLNNYS